MWAGIIRALLFLSGSCSPVTPLTSARSEWMHINTPGSQQHLTNLANYLRGHFYRAFLLLRWRGEWKESKIERLDEGIWARRACSHLHTLPALRLSQSPVEEAPVSLPQSSPSTPLSRCFFHPSITAASQPSTPKNHPASRCSPSNSQQRGRDSKRGS